MKIIRAEHLGMCFGVKDAIALALATARREPLTILGDLVHNESVLAELRAKFDHPHMFANLEKVCTEMPGGIERVRSTAARIRGMLASMKAAAATS